MTERFRDTLLRENLPVLRPFLAQARWRHDNDWALIGTLQKNRYGNGHCYECFPHANFVREDHTRLSGEPAKDLSRRTFLPLRVFR